MREVLQSTLIQFNAIKLSRFLRKVRILLRIVYKLKYNPTSFFEEAYRRQERSCGDHEMLEREE
jgi:hypothetical protein